MKICPKCSYQRKPADDEFTSTMECPRCGVVYEKFKGDTVEKEIETKSFINDPSKYQTEENKGNNKPQSGRNGKVIIIGISLSLIIIIPTVWLAFYIYHSNNEYSKAYRAIKKIEASLESGISFQEYSKAVNDVKFEINMLLKDTPKKKDIQSIYNWYQLSKEIWRCKIGCDWREKRNIIKKAIFLLEVHVKKNLSDSLILFSDKVADIIIDQIIRQHGIEPISDSSIKDNMIDDANLNAKQKSWLKDMYGDNIMDTINQLIWSRASQEIREYETH